LSVRETVQQVELYEHADNRQPSLLTRRGFTAAVELKDMWRVDPISSQSAAAGTSGPDIGLINHGKVLDYFFQLSTKQIRK
jgi:hypothetical protein